MSGFKTVTKGIIKENPVFRLVLGTCPTLAVTTSAENALGMGAAVIFCVDGVKCSDFPFEKGDT